MIIDFHTHAFPDALAERAMPQLEREGNVAAVLDGKVSSLLRSMDEAGIHASVVASIATRPHQFDAILQWSAAIASERIIPFPSVHPADPDAVARVRQVRERGFHGLKLHPYYQDFEVDEPRLRPLYEAAQDCRLVVLCHTGFDPAFPRVRRGDPERILRVVEAFPRLAFVAPHLGAWDDWDEVDRHLTGKPVWMDLSYAIGLIEPERARSLILRHPADRMLFGSDSPWAGQRETIDWVRQLGLGAEREALILGGNATRLLGLHSPPGRTSRAQPSGERLR